MYMPGADSSTAPITHYKQIAKTGKIVPELLEYQHMECPDELQDVLDDFMQLNKKRQFSDGGPLPISYTEIKAWAFSYDVVLSPLKVELYDLLDEIWISVWAAKHSKAHTKKKSKTNGG